MNGHSWGLVSAGCLIAAAGLLFLGAFEHDPLLNSTALATVIAATIGGLGIGLAYVIHRILNPDCGAPSCAKSRATSSTTPPTPSASPPTGS